ncbi:hypothetical protein TcWFU_003714 [Taenia crassiceps]|uniref:Uncharacterized protein n=1 Tax=Taenia crassiceps TaxID=6207 RepID=A0ABR4Q3Y1_9CEST
MQTHLLCLLAFSTVFVLLAEAEARHWHGRALVKKEVATGDEAADKVSKEGEEDENEEEEKQKREEEEGEKEQEAEGELDGEGEEHEGDGEEEEEEDAETAGKDGEVGAEGEAEDVDEASASGAIERKALRKRTFGSEVDDEMEDFGEYDNEDEGYYKIDKKSWDTFCEKMKNYWQNVGNGIRDEWCKLRAMFSKL